MNAVSPHLPHSPQNVSLIEQALRDIPSPSGKSLINFANFWFDLTNNPFHLSDEVKWMLYFAACAYRDESGAVRDKNGAIKNGSFNVSHLNVNDLVMLYRIINSFFIRHPGEEKEVFFEHLCIIETGLRELSQQSPQTKQEIIDFLKKQNDRHLELMIASLSSDEPILAGLRSDLSRGISTDEKAINLSMTSLIVRVAKVAFETSKPPKLVKQIIQTSFVPVSEEKLKFHIGWAKRIVYPHEAEYKMAKNATKAVAEHIKADKRSPYAMLAEIHALNERFQTQNLLKLKVMAGAHSAKGFRDSMEDAHFHAKTKWGTLSAIFDGHGGSGVAEFASLMVPTLLEEEFSKIERNPELNRLNVHQVFEVAIQRLEKAIAEKSQFFTQGSTATIVFIDTTTHIAYTANLGDSEAKLYTEIDGQIKIIPLSCVRNWSSKYDAKRAAVVMNNPKIELLWRNQSHLAKERRLEISHNGKLRGLNVSRGIGDFWGKQTETPGISNKPKISMQKLLIDPKEGTRNTIVIACDGVWDFVDEQDLIKLLNSENNPETLAKKIVDRAINAWDSEDNVSVIVLSIS